MALHYRASEPGCRLYADSRKLQQILRHLLKNAVKYTGPGGKVDVTLDRDAAGGLVIRISDTGIGIAAEDLPKVFEAFRQVDSKLSRWYEGTGLGVPLSCILAERHGGTLDIESEPGRGTTVIVAFPADRTVAPKIDAA